MTDETEAVLVQLRKGVLEYCVLSCLRGGPAYGLELAQRLAPHRALFGAAGTLYPLLSRLKKKGRVETYWEESTSGPPRQYYRLSPAGIRSLEAFERVWGRFGQDVQTVLGESAS